MPEQFLPGICHPVAHDFLQEEVEGLAHTGTGNAQRRQVLALDCQVPDGHRIPPP